MDNLRDAFEDVADWCERHLEGERGREIGMTFGAMLRAYGRVAALPARPGDEAPSAEEQQLNARAERLRLDFSTRFPVAYGCVGNRSKLVEPISMRTNITYDTGPRPQE